MWWNPFLLSTVNQIIFRLNQLGNSFNIFTLKCHLTTTVMHYPKILFETECIIPFWNHANGQNTMWLVKTAFISMLVWQCLLLAASGPTSLHPPQCLLNVGPASPVLAIIHSAPVSTSCWRECSVRRVVDGRKREFVPSSLGLDP